MTDRPTWPGDLPDYRNELLFARFSRVAYLDKEEVLDPDPEANPDYADLFARSEPYLRWRHRGTHDLNGSSGLVMHVVTKEHPGRQLVIAIRGSDNLADWSGPNVAVARDGDLLELMNLPGPATRRTRGQMRQLQETLLPGDAWDPQFRDALEFAREVQQTYGAQGYEIKVAGHSGGGAHAQVIAHTFGWEGRTFDAPGAANIVQSKGYGEWLATHGIEPVGAPRYRSDPFVSGLLNYTVNNSAVAYSTGPHLGERQSISSYVGRDGAGSKVRHAAGVIGGGIGDTPLLGPTLKLSGIGRLGTLVTTSAHGAQYGVDAMDRHDINRVVALFEEAVRRQDRGDARPLPTLGGQGARKGASVAALESETGAALRDRSAPVLQGQAQAGRDEPGQDALARFLDATRCGDRSAFRDAAHVLCATPQAAAWLDTGFARLDAQRADNPIAPVDNALRESASGDSPALR